MNEQNIPATTPAAPAASAPKKKGGWGKWVALGCGCLFLVFVAVALILAAIAIPTFTAAKGKAQDAQAAIKLRNGVTAAVTYYADKQSYDGLNAAELGKLESAVRFQDGAPGPDLQVGVVYVDPASVSKDSFQMTVKSESGMLIRVSNSKSGMKFEKSDNGVTWKDLTSE